MTKREFSKSTVYIMVLLVLSSAIMAEQNDFGSDNLELICDEITTETVLTEVDLSTDGKVTMSDLAQLAQYWLRSDCQESNNWCQKADIDMSGDVGLSDLITLADNWMNDVYPTSYYLDDFNDNLMGSMWTLLTPPVSYCWLDETNNRLEVRATTNSNDDFALYVPNGWYLDTSQDFGFKIFYHNTIESVTWSELLLAIGDPEDIEDNHLQFSVCSESNDWDQPERYFYYDLINNGSEIDDLYVLRSTDDGWLYISYDHVSDDIYVSNTGYGMMDAVITVSGLLQTDWNGKHIAPHIGGSSDHVEMLSGQAYWDNLIIDYGEVIYE